MIVQEAARKAPCRVRAVHSNLDGQNSAERRLKHHYSCVVRVKTRQSFSKEEIFQVPSEQPQFPPTFESFSLSWKKDKTERKTHPLVLFYVPQLTEFTPKSFEVLSVLILSVEERRTAQNSSETCQRSCGQKENWNANAFQGQSVSATSCCQRKREESTKWGGRGRHWPHLPPDLYSEKETMTFDGKRRSTMDQVQGIPCSSWGTIFSFLGFILILFCLFLFFYFFKLKYS